MIRFRIELLTTGREARLQAGSRLDAVMQKLVKRELSGNVAWC